MPAPTSPTVTTYAPTAALFQVAPSIAWPTTDGGWETLGDGETNWQHAVRLLRASVGHGAFVGKATVEVQLGKSYRTHAPYGSATVTPAMLPVAGRWCRILQSTQVLWVGKIRGVTIRQTNVATIDCEHAAGVLARLMIAYGGGSAAGALRYATPFALNDLGAQGSRVSRAAIVGGLLDIAKRPLPLYGADEPWTFPTLPGAEDAPTLATANRSLANSLTGLLSPDAGYSWRVNDQGAGASLPIESLDLDAAGGPLVLDADNIDGAEINRANSRVRFSVVASERPLTGVTLHANGEAGSDGGGSLEPLGWSRVIVIPPEDPEDPETYETVQVPDGDDNDANASPIWRVFGLYDGWNGLQWKETGTSVNGLTRPYFANGTRAVVGTTYDAETQLPTDFGDVLVRKCRLLPTLLAPDGFPVDPRLGDEQPARVIIRSGGVWYDMTAELPIRCGGGPGSAEGGIASVSVGTTLGHARTLYGYAQEDDFLLLVSLAVQEPDAMLAWSEDEDAEDTSALRAVDVPGYELRQVCAGTVVGVGDDGALVYSAEETSFPAFYTVIDETPELFAEAQALKARSLRDEISVAWTLHGDTSYTWMPGDVISTATMNGAAYTVNAPVATVEWDFQQISTSVRVVPIVAREAVG
jgi:hypothetical protein